MIQADEQRLVSGSWEGVMALQQEELRRGLDVRQLHTTMFRTFREELARTFLQHYVFKVTTPDEPAVQVWEPLKMRRNDALDESLTGLVELVDGLDDESADLLDDGLDGAFVDGYDRELWLIGLGGLPAAADYRLDLPESDDRRRLLLAAGLAGLSWRQRLSRWGGDTKQRSRQWLRASVMGGRSLDETLQGLDGAFSTYTGRVVALQGDEMQRAYTIGQQVAIATVQQDHDDVVEVWITRQDKLVCPVCAALHMTITTLRPVDDTHPRCRCRKVPLTAGGVPRSISFDRFMGRT